MLNGTECEDVFSLQDVYSPWRNNLPIKYYPAAMDALMKKVRKDQGEHTLPIVAKYCWKSLLHKTAIAHLAQNGIYIQCVRVLDEHVGFEGDTDEFEGILYNINTAGVQEVNALVSEIQAGGQLSQVYSNIFIHSRQDTTPLADGRICSISLGVLWTGPGKQALWRTSEQWSG